MNAIGKPTGAKPFGNLADVFTQSVYTSGTRFCQIDVVFDRYDEDSIKGETRIKRRKGISIRGKIETPDVPLPPDWAGFMSLPDNKSDLTRFLSEELIRKAHSDKTMIVAGGLLEQTAVIH